MTVIGVLSAISIMMSMLPFIGYIPIGPIKATIMHIPVIIGAIIEGPVVGAIIGLIFGLTSLWNAITQPVVLSPLFYNPLVSVLPRILIGIVAYYVYQGVYKVSKKVYASGFIAGIIGSLANTAGVLGLTYILAMEQFATLKEISSAAVAGALGTIAVSNGIPECIVAVMIVVPVCLALFKLNKRR